MCTPDLAKSFSDYLKRLGRRAFGAERAVGTKAFRDENKEHIQEDTWLKGAEQRVIPGHG